MTISLSSHRHTHEKGRDIIFFVLFYSRQAFQSFCSIQIKRQKNATACKNMYSLLTRIWYELCSSVLVFEKFLLAPLWERLVVIFLCYFIIKASFELLPFCIIQRKDQHQVWIPSSQYKFYIMFSDCVWFTFLYNMGLYER